MQRGSVYPIHSDPTLHFTEALAQNAYEVENIRLEESIAAGRHCRSILRHVTIVSVQALAWEVVLFNRRAFAVDILGNSSFLASWRFSADNGKQYGTSTLYHYHASNIDLPYWDADFIDQTLPRDHQGGNLHVMVVNRSLTAKSAGAAGAVRLTAFLEPTYG